MRKMEDKIAVGMIGEPTHESRISVGQARKLKKARLNFHDEKLKSIEISKGAKVHYTISQRIRYTKIIIKNKLKDFLKKITSCPENSWFHEKAVLLRTDGTFENYILKSIFGFLGGIFLTYIFFIFIVFQLNFTLSSATIWCSLLGIVLTIGLAFSSRIRCVVFLLMPQLFSKRGRQVLMAYAFILAITGPAKNTLHNIGVLSESLACGQEQLKEAVKTIVDLIKQPFYALKDAIAKVVKTVKVVIKKIKKALIAIKRLVLSILRGIKSVFAWLGSIINICNKELGTPFDRCQRVFEGAVTDCKAKLGPLFGGICNVTYVVGSLCYIVKPLDFICILVSFIADAIVGTVRRKIKKFAKHMKAMFYVKIKFSHSFHFETNHSRSISDVSKGISTEIRLRTEKFLKFFDLMNFVTSFFIFIFILRVIHYRHKWLTNTRFDNRYLTDYIREIDLRRARLDKETVLPLNPRERKKFIPLTSIALIKVEKIHLAKSAVFLFSTSCKLLFHMAVDYSLYWILSVIRYYGRIETKVQRPNSVGVFVSGNGFLAELYKSIVKAFSPSTSVEEIDTIPCLPDPIPPDLDRYTQIISLIILCWIMAVFEPYGLRLRHVVMGAYHPERAKERAVWLYNHIIRSRGSFLKFARRQLRRKFGIIGGENIEKVTCRERLTAMCPILNKFFPMKQKACLLCGVTEREGQLPHIKCPTPGCIGLFCVQCFSDLQNLCTVCKTPIDYGDLSDISEEKDSSEEEMLKIQKPLSPTTTEKKEGEVEGTEGEQLTEDDLEEITSSTDYSYTYQDDETQVYGDLPQRKPFRDIEAQKLRDDVSTQIFNIPIEDFDSFSESPTSCFVFQARRGLKSRVKKLMKASSDKEKSFANSTASSSSEKIDEEELIELKVDDSFSEILLSSRCEENKRKKHSRIKRMFTALSKIIWLGRKNRSEKPIKTCKFSQKGKKGVTKMKTSSLSSTDMSSSSSSNVDCRDSDVLLTSKKKRRRRRRRRRRRKSLKYDEASAEILYTRNCDSHREKHRHCPTKFDNQVFKYPHEECFSPKKLPRGLVPVAKEIRYFEVDERKTCPSKLYNDKDGLNILSDTKSSSDTSRFTETWNIRCDDDFGNYGSMSSQDSQEVYEASKKISASSMMTTIEEDSQETSRSKDSKDDSIESSNDSEQYIDVTGLSSDDSSFANEICPYSRISKKLDKIVEKTDKITSGRKRMEEIGHETKAYKIDEIQSFPKSCKERCHFHRKTVERRLQRRRNNGPNYYSSSDNGHCDKNFDEDCTRKKKERQRCTYEKSPRSSKRCRHYFRRDCRKGRSNDQCPKNVSRQYERGFKRIFYSGYRQEPKNYTCRDTSESEEGSTRQQRIPLKNAQKTYDNYEFRKAKKNKRINTLPYQETESFKGLVNEYRQKAFSEEKPISTEEPSILPIGRESKEAKNLFPPEGCTEKKSLISRFKIKIGSAFQTNKSNLNDDAEEIKLMNNRGEVANVNQLESESTSEMSS